MFHRMAQIIFRVLYVIGVGLTLLVLLEAVRLAVFFFQLHPIAGWSFIVLLTGLLMWGVGYIWREVGRYPPPLIPPPVPDLEQATHDQMKRYCRYLIRYLRRLSGNPHLEADQRAHLQDQLETMTALLGQHPLNEDLRHIITKTDTELLPPIQLTLRNCAEKEIRRSVRDVMLGVTLSPYHGVDILIVLYRNFAMVLRIIGIYENRPAARAQWRIVRDVFRVVATVNFLYIGRNLIENLFAFVPWVGRVADDIGQGLGAGLFTSAAGHAVIQRCATYRDWEKQAAVDSLAAQSRDFLRDVRNIFTKDVLPDIKTRIINEAPAEERRQPGFWDQVQGGLNSAFDATFKTVGNLWPRSAS
jgi:uncharacterized membrane protein YcjF (UPF0283 family)